MVKQPKSLVNTDALTKAFNGDLDLLLFYLAWVKNGLNAKEAYKELHPNVDGHSASVLGSRMLGKVDRYAVMQAYGLDHANYFEQLKDAMKATKWNDFTGEREADHNTRRPYHDKLGKLLGIEDTQAGVQINMSMGLLIENYRNDQTS